MLAALVQYAPRLGDLRANLASHLQLIEQAIDGGAELVVFPELSLTGYTLRDLAGEMALRPDDARLQPFRDLSQHLTIVVGGVEEGQRHGIFNAAFVFDQGQVTTHRKVYPPDYGIFEEGRYFLRGDTVRCIPTRHGLLGVLICEDAWHLSLPLLQTLEGADFLVVISASPTQLAGQGGLSPAERNTQHHATLCRLLSVHMVFVNRVGYEDGVNYWGNSQVVDPFGQVLMSIPAPEEDLRFCDIDESALRRARQKSRHFLDEDPLFLRAELERVIALRAQRR